MTSFGRCRLDTANWMKIQSAVKIRRLAKCLYVREGKNISAFL